MADNVFGKPITDETLRGMPEYRGRQITKRDRAHVALLFKNSGNELLENARRYLDELKRQSEDGVSTLCLVYNASGDTITCVNSHDWSGHIGPGPYPSEIANGQWGAFLHVKTYASLFGSNAAVVYRCKNEAGQECDWVVAWDNPFNRICYDSKVYAEIQEAHHFDNDGVWEIINSALTNTNGHNHQDISNGFKSTVEIGQDTSAKLDAVLTLAPVEKKRLK